MTVNVVWFKRDLRLADHEPLSDAAGEIEPTILLYVIEPVRLNQPDTDPTHIAWELDCANELDKSLRKIGGSLRIVHSNIIDCLKQIHREHGINSIYSHQETGTTWSYGRDRAVKKW